MAAATISRRQKSSAGRVWVVAVNDSDASKNAFGEVIELLGEHDAVHAVTVGSPCDGSLLPPGALVPESMFAKMREQEAARCADVMAYYRGKAARLGLKFTEHVLFAAPAAAALCDKARELDASYLVIGQRLEVATLTRSADKVRLSHFCIQHAPCHVFIVRASTERSRPALKRSDTQEVRRAEIEKERADLVNKMAHTGRAAMTSSVAVGFDDDPSLADTLLSSSPHEPNRLNL